jgi:hypothetical protein
LLPRSEAAHSPNDCGDGYDDPPRVRRAFDTDIGYFLDALTDGVPKVPERCLGRFGTSSPLSFRETYDHMLNMPVVSFSTKIPKPMGE